MERVVKRGGERDMEIDRGRVRMIERVRESKGERERGDICKERDEERW